MPQSWWEHNDAPPKWELFRTNDLAEFTDKSKNYVLKMNDFN